MRDIEDIADIQKSKMDVFSEEDDEELDLIKLVSTNANDTSQYLVFVGSDEQYYAKNVSKIEELLVYKDINVAKNSEDGLITGTADIRGNMTTIINFDKWIGNRVLEDKDYELIILAYYGGHRLGIIVKRVEYIVNIPSDTMTDNSGNNPKTSFISRIQIAGKEDLCMIFDSDKMLLDVFEELDSDSSNFISKLTRTLDTNKVILVADDSRFIREMIKELLEKMGVVFKIFENGQLLYDYLEKMDVDEVGLIVTDLEMPVLGGRELIGNIRKQHKYDTIKIVVHTNMSNINTEQALLKLGANEILGKVNMSKLTDTIIKILE